ncbi:LOW QUALITY PROTEIN: pre-mRNA-splicing factor ISY1 homolog [Passer montanus]|uniref:LOW QUALITY PROTEIN: pre-mRNA-splicing factor ISY1 homolog n=1 Tax=Passer montanus TaxID=9160 RepID=UPI00195F85B3|nr:LOW QUALITY PROTEIN: pre-mRNA-splicing factor ISY1 homolog [Passer montanus]
MGQWVQRKGNLDRVLEGASLHVREGRQCPRAGCLGLEQPGTAAGWHCSVPKVPPLPSPPCSSSGARQRACAARVTASCASGARRRTGERAGFCSGVWSCSGHSAFGGTEGLRARRDHGECVWFSVQQERRPFLASECNELPKAEKWRRQIIGEISKKVAQIQNAGLGEFRIRDLNDEINKLLREKGHWEYRIKELGGPDYARIGPKMLDHEGKEVPGNRGYKYFGAAKDLPGVRELFEKEPLPPPRKTRAELMKDIDAEYYGYRDEDDGILEPLEQEHEKKVIAEAVEKWKMEREARLARGEEEEEENIYAVQEEESDEEGGKEREGEDGQQKFIAHVPVPTQQEIEEALVRRKKMELLQKYASETLLAQSEEAKTLLGL